MLLRLTINGRRKSFAYYADEIEAAKAYKGQIGVNSICEKSVTKYRFFPERSGLPMGKKWE